MIRKIFNNNFFAFFLVVPFTVCFLSSLFSPVFVSASADVSSFPDLEFDSGVDRSSYESVIESLKQNDSIADIGDCYILLNVGARCEFYIFKDFTNVKTVYDGFYGSNVECFIPSKYGKFENIEKSVVSSYNFVLSDFSYNNSRVLGVFPRSSVSFPFMPLGLNQSDQIYDHNVNVYCFYSSVTPPFVPSSNNVLSLGIDEDGFYNWLLDTSKDSNFAPYLPLNRLFQYLQFYDAWGSSPQKFLMMYNIDYGDTIGSHLNNLQIIELKNLTDRLYREYLNSLKYPLSDFPARDRVNIRKDIDTNTTDNNTVLITDDSNDSVIVSILRDILRGVIALRNQIFVTGTDIITGLNNLDFTVNVANDGGSGFNASDIWGSGNITESENYLALTAAFMDKGVDVSSAENLQINYLDNATQRDSFTVSVVMPDRFVNGQFTEKTVTHTIDNTSKMYNTLILFRKLIAFAVVAYFAIRIRFELPHLIRGE